MTQINPLSFLKKKRGRESMDFAHKLGKRIKELRKKAGNSQEQLAERAGTSGKYVGEIERGEVNVSAYILVKIAEVLDVDMLQLLDFDHLEKTELLKKEIIELLDKADNDEVRQIYRGVPPALVYYPAMLLEAARAAA